VNYKKLTFFGNEIQKAVSHQFCMRFLVMRYSTKVFEHANVTRWHHCNSDYFIQ